jgi:hypothetical protein
MRLCKVCTLPPKMRAEIDAALVDGTTYDRIVARFSQVDRPINTMNLSRHRRHLLPKELVRRAPAPEPEVALSLVQRVEGLMADSKQIAVAAKTGQQWIAATSALREVRCCIELLGKLTGEISPANFNFATFNFANLTEDQIGAFLDAIAQRGDDRIRAMVTAKLGSLAQMIRVSFVGVVERCPQCGYTKDAATEQPLPREAPSNGSNGHA